MSETLPLLQRYGFEPARMRFALRTALACCAAVMLAWLMGLEHPQWSGMSVWAASQPLRGQLLEKSFFRFAGTVSGTIVGVILISALQVHPLLMIAGLALWIGACTWIGNLQRGLVAYGTVLAGYSASMVALLTTSHPDQVLHLGADRLATVLTGVVVATLVGYLFAQRTEEADLRGRTTRLLRDLLRHLAEPPPRGSDDQRFLARFAAIEEDLDPHSAGSVRSRRDTRAVRGVLLATVPLLLRETGAHLDPRTAERLIAAADALEQGNVIEAADALAAEDAPELRDTLHNLAAALHAWTPASGVRPEQPARLKAFPVVLHRDWIGAREAGLRAGGAMLLFGLIWFVTGWNAGAYMLLGLSVMISLFSTFESPTITMRHIFAGQLVAVIAAVVCRWLVWPYADNEWQQILLLFPFILMTPLFIGHRNMAIAATDFNMVFLLLSQPHYPLTGDVQSSIVLGLAVLAGPLTAWAGYQLIFPINLQRRQQHLLAMMRRDLASIATTPEALDQQLVWRARIYHRVLRLVRVSEKLARADHKAQMTGRAMLLLVHAALRCHQLQHAAESLPSLRRAARLALGRLARIDDEPEQAAAAFEQLSRRLDTEDAVFMQQAAAAVARISGDLGG